jgi:hypothetical protein
MKNCLVLGLICLSATACTYTPAKDPKSAGVVCTNEAPLGSHLTKRKCTTAAEREKARQQAEETTSAPTTNTR